MNKIYESYERINLSELKTLIHLIHLIHLFRSMLFYFIVTRLKVLLYPHPQVGKVG